MKGNQRIRCKRKDRPQGHALWHSPHAAEHCAGILCRWQRVGQASRCPMRRGNR